MSVQLTTLKSGINVVTDTMPHLETASLGVWVASGSRDERRDEHGISHLLEHMAFKGTRRRTARQIAEEIEAVGGDLNAATGAESTAYYARVLKQDVPLALDVLSDILSHTSNNSGTDSTAGADSASSSSSTSGSSNEFSTYLKSIETALGTGDTTTAESLVTSLQSYLAANQPAQASGTYSADGNVITGTTSTSSISALA